MRPMPNGPSLLFVHAVRDDEPRPPPPTAFPFTRVCVWHDAENAPFPSLYRVRNADGTPSHFHPLDMNHPDIKGELAVDETLRIALSCFVDPTHPFLERTSSTRLCQLITTFQYQFVLHRPTRDNFDSPTNVFHPTSACMSGLLATGVTHVDPGIKHGAVDHNIQKSMTDFVDQHKADSEELKAATLIVIITSDRDFSYHVSRMQSQGGFNNIVIIANEDGNPNSAYLRCVGAGRAVIAWRRIVDIARGVAPNMAAPVTVFGASGGGGGQQHQHQQQKRSVSFKQPGQRRGPCPTTPAVADEPLVPRVEQKQQVHRSSSFKQPEQRKSHDESRQAQSKLHMHPLATHPKALYVHPLATHSKALCKFFASEGRLQELQTELVGIHPRFTIHVAAALDGLVLKAAEAVSSDASGAASVPVPASEPSAAEVREAAKRISAFSLTAHAEVVTVRGVPVTRLARDAQLLAFARVNNTRIFFPGCAQIDAEPYSGAVAAVGVGAGATKPVHKNIVGVIFSSPCTEEDVRDLAASCDAPIFSHGEFRYSKSPVDGVFQGSAPLDKDFASTEFTADTLEDKLKRLYALKTDPCIRFFPLDGDPPEIEGYAPKAVVIVCSFDKDAADAARVKQMLLSRERFNKVITIYHSPTGKLVHWAWSSIREKLEAVDDKLEVQHSVHEVFLAEARGGGGKGGGRGGRQGGGRGGRQGGGKRVTEVDVRFTGPPESVEKACVKLDTLLKSIKCLEIAVPANVPENAIWPLLMSAQRKLDGTKAAEDAPPAVNADGGAPPDADGANKDLQMADGPISKVFNVARDMIGSLFEVTTPQPPVSLAKPGAHGSDVAEGGADDDATLATGPLAASRRNMSLWTFHKRETQVQVYFLPEAQAVVEEVRDMAEAMLADLNSLTVDTVSNGLPVPGMAKLLTDRTLEPSLRKNFTLYEVVVYGNAIRLTGPRSEVSAARDYLVDKARGGAAETRVVFLPDRRLWALCAQQRPPAWGPELATIPGVTATPAPMGLRLAGTRAKVAAAEAKWLQVAAGLAAKLVEETVPLTQAQEAYLQGEGATILTKIGVAPGGDQQVVAETLRSAALRSNEQPQLPDAAGSSLSTTAAPACQLLASYLAKFPAPAWVLSLYVCLADFREVDADAVVNAANDQLRHNGGIALAIGEAGGPAFTAECNARVASLSGGKIAPGSALITGSGNLGKTAGITAVVHAVAPMCPRAGPSATDVAFLKATMREALRLAAANGTKILAVPALGCKIYGWDADVATRYIVEETIDWAVAQSVAPSLRRVVFCDIDAATAATFARSLDAATADTFARSLRARVHATGAPVRPQPTSAGPIPTGQRAPIRKPVSLWEWYHYETLSWMKYDYDQNVRLEEWYGDASSHAKPVRIMGDLNGTVAVHAKKPPGMAGGVYEVARKQCEVDGEPCSMRQENVVSGFGRAVRRTRLPPGHESLVPLYKERLAADVESRKVEAGLAQQAHALQALPNPAGQVASARLPIFVPDPSAPLSMPVPAPAPASGSVGAGGGAASGVRPGGWPAHGVLLTGLKSAGLESNLAAAKSSLTTALIGALKRSEEPVSLAACDGTFSEKMAALRAALQRAGADAVEDNVALQTVRVSALGEGGVSRGERELLKWVAQSVAAAREREAAQGFVKFPDEWEGGPFDASTTGMRLVPVASGSSEYQEVCRRFRLRPDLSAPAFPNAVLSVERVQNPMAYASYDKEKKIIAAKGRNNGNPNELWMKHGTRTDPVAIISGEVGLDFRYSASGFFGRATYLAEDAAYSDGGYQYKASPTAHKMLLVRVAAGRIFKSERNGSLNTPPSGYDSVRGDVAPGNMAVMVYNVSQCYPAYLITYTPTPTPT